MSGNSISRDPGTAFAVVRPPLGVTSGSTIPWITSVGHFTAANSGVRSRLAKIAADAGTVRKDYGESIDVEIRFSSADGRDLCEGPKGAHNADGTFYPDTVT